MIPFRAQRVAGRLLVALGLTVVVVLGAPGNVDDSGRWQPAGPTASGGEAYAALGSRSPTSPSPVLSPVEWELVRLTNELRADPSGHLRRLGARPTCVDDPFHAITIDGSTGHPFPSPALAVDATVSVEMARDWATRMFRTGLFTHRPASAQRQVYRSLALNPLAWGENIAWAAGYPAEEVARVHFEGWRESDDGHYCSLLSPRFTQVGAGEVRVEGQSWAVLNFYHPAN